MPEVSLQFTLDEDFLDSYKSKKPPFGFGVLGEIVYLRTYSRLKEDGSNEVWWETVRRVVEGTYRMQESWVKQHRLTWNEDKAQRSAQEMYDRIFHMKFLPPGRGLWAMGSKAIDAGVYEALFNCAAVSTERIGQEGYRAAEPFLFLMDISMKGVGCGFDVKGEGGITIQEPGAEEKGYVVSDSREGWVRSTGKLLDTYFEGGPRITFDYSEIRPAGEPIKTFGGIAPGPQPLINLHKDLRQILEERVGEPLSRRLIVDIFNLIGKAVVSGGIRRTAEIALGPNSEDYLNLKNYDKHPEREGYGWVSNNSVFAELGMDYSDIVDRIVDNGEPGLIWLENIQKYSRMSESPDYKDDKAVLINPCQPADALVLTPDGIRRLGEVGPGDLIWSGKRWTGITRKVYTGSKPVYRYKTRAGVFVGTEDHRVVSDGSKVPVSEAETIDVCDVDSRLGETQWIPQAVMDGLVMGDGYVKSSNEGRQQYMLLCIGYKDEEWFDSEVGHLIGNQFDGVDYRVKTTLTPDELSYTYERRVPERYLRARAHEVVSFLRGVYSANGSICGNRVTLKSASLGLIEDVQAMLSSVGIRSYYTVNKPHEVEFCNGMYTCKESYDLNITSDRQRFRSLIGFIQTDKMERLDEACKIDSNHRKHSYEIVEVEELGTQPVFDITVEAPEHTYWSQGLLVSNCGEIPLESMELCNICETFPDHHDSKEDFLRTLKFAYLYSKTVTLSTTAWPETNKVILRNRRIGVSMTGIAQFIEKRGLQTLRQWCQDGYDEIQRLDAIYSDWLAIPRSKKTTTVKPSGNTSLLGGVTAGMHYPESRFYIRRVRLSVNSPLAPKLESLGYNVEPCYGSEDSTVVVEVPVDMGEGVRPVSEVSAWEQMSLAAFLQSEWSDNAVSCTVSFNPETERDQLGPALDYFQYKLKSVSFLPRHELGAYKQMPYERITRKKYDNLCRKLKGSRIGRVEGEKADPEKYCAGDTCVL